MTDRTAPADPREALDPIVGYSTTDFAPTTEGTEVVGRFVFHDGHWWYAGKAARQDEPSPALRDLLDEMDARIAADEGTVPHDGWMTPEQARQRGSLQGQSAAVGYIRNRLGAALRAANPPQTREAASTGTMDRDWLGNWLTDALDRCNARENYGLPHRPADLGWMLADELIAAGLAPQTREAREHVHSMWECGRMRHVGSSHWTDEPCSKPEDDPDRCTFAPFRRTRLDLKPQGREFDDAGDPPATYRFTMPEINAMLARRQPLVDMLIEQSTAADQAAEDGEDPSPDFHRGVRHMADATLTWLGSRTPAGRAYLRIRAGQRDAGNRGIDPQEDKMLDKCGLCSSTTVVRLAPDWQEQVEAGERVPIIACGNPWHYCEPKFDAERLAATQPPAAGTEAPE